MQTQPRRPRWAAAREPGARVGDPGSLQRGTFGRMAALRDSPGREAGLSSGYGPVGRPVLRRRLLPDALLALAPAASEHWFAAVYDPVLWYAEQRSMADRRRALLAQAKGRVLEIGAGTGLNLRHYPESVKDLVLVEPSLPMMRRLARNLDLLGSQARIVRANAEFLPFPDDSFDCVVASFVFCTVKDPCRSLQELARVTRPGGLFLFLEHVRARSSHLAFWQDRLDPIWRRLAGGCHCNRSTLEAFLTSPFKVIHLDRADWVWMPFTVRPTIEGWAVLSPSTEQDPL